MHTHSDTLVYDFDQARKGKAREQKEEWSVTIALGELRCKEDEASLAKIH